MISDTNSALRMARRWANAVLRARSQSDKRRAARKVVDALLVAINGKPCDRTHPLELSGRVRR
jgi:hypothetical protein